MNTRRDELRQIKWRPGSGHEPGQAGRECADALRRDAGVDRPVLARLERLDLFLAGADEAERHRLFAPRRADAANLPPELLAFDAATAILGAVRFPVARIRLAHAFRS